MKRMPLLFFALCFSIPSYGSGHYLHFGANLAAAAVFLNGSSSDAPANQYESTIEFEKNYAWGYEYRNSTPNDWGLVAGFTKYTKSEVTSIELDGSKQSPTPNHSINVTSFYLNSIYRWEQLYLPFGLNYGQIGFSPANGSTSSASSGGFGFNLGVGFKLTDWVIVEYLYRTTVWDLETRTGGITTDFGTGALAMSTLSLKFKLY